MLRRFQDLKYGVGNIGTVRKHFLFVQFALFRTLQPKFSILCTEVDVDNSTCLLPAVLKFFEPGVVLL